nr:unnamed protein product [Callosobruchus analis]
MHYENRRGELTTSWMAELGLIAINEGTHPTFVRSQSTSILDITLATERVASECRNWKVLDKERFSKKLIFDFFPMLLHLQLIS